MKHQIEAAYIGIESPDPSRVGRYLESVVGLMPGAPTPGGAVTFRADSKAQRVFVQRGPGHDAVCIGFEAIDAESFDAAARRLRGLGVELTPGSAAEKAERRVADLLGMPSPWGPRVELVLRLEEASTPFESSAFEHGIVTEGQGFGHFVFGVGNDEAYAGSRRFAMEGLGLRLSDTLRMPVGGGDMHVTFLHCNPRHHSLALARVPLPTGAPALHHINFEVAAVRDVGIAYERALRSGTPIANTIGQHANDRMISFYSMSPDGWQVEIGATGKVVGDDWNGVREYDRISDWGHQPPQVLADLQRAARPCETSAATTALP